MLAVLFEIEKLAWCPFVGLTMTALFCIHFFFMLVYGIIAECASYPMPLDERYLIGKINLTIMITLMCGGLIFLII